MAKTKSTQPVEITSTTSGQVPQTTQGQHKRRYVQRKRFFMRPWLVISSACLVLIIIVGVFMYMANKQTMVAIIGPTDPIVLQDVTSLQSHTFAEVGTANVNNNLQRTPGSTALLTGPQGKPEFFYYGAEFCPYCAAERWSLAVALSRFGKFNQLPESASSSSDTDPNTATFTFVGSRYSSPYIDFVALEAEDRVGGVLQAPDDSEQQILKRYHVNGFPFIDIADQFTINGPQYSPDILGGLSQKDIARQLTDNTANSTQNIVGAANYLIAAICAVTHNQPTTTCTSNPIPLIQQILIPRQAAGSIKR